MYHVLLKWFRSVALLLQSAVMNLLLRSENDLLVERQRLTNTEANASTPINMIAQAVKQVSWCRGMCEPCSQSAQPRNQGNF
jgi:hypothetical protein